MTRVDRWETYIYTLSSTYWKPTIWSEAPDVKQLGPNMCEVRGLTQRPGHRGQGSDLRVSLSSQPITTFTWLWESVFKFQWKRLGVYYTWGWIAKQKNLSSRTMRALKFLRVDVLAWVFPMDTQWTLNGHSMDTQWTLQWSLGITSHL